MGGPTANLTLRELVLRSNTDLSKLPVDTEVWIYDERRDREAPALYAEKRVLPDSEKTVLMIGVAI